MLAIKRMVQLCTTLTIFFSFSLAEDGEHSGMTQYYDVSIQYDPSTNYRIRNVTGLGDFYSWVGSYYNATAEVELEFVSGWQYDEPLCPQLENYTHTAKFDAILSILERGHWNAGNNSVIFSLTLLPQTSPPFNVSILDYRSMAEWWKFGISYPIYSASFLEHTYYRPQNSIWGRPKNGSSPDLFNFTTSQVSGGAYNISGTVYPKPDLGLSSLFSNFSGMPVCDSTTQSNTSHVYMMSRPEREPKEVWDDFQYPHTSIQFDDKTANLTLDGYFHSLPYDHKKQTSVMSSARGFLRVRFSGILDEYYSDSLSLNGSTPTWLRTVGWSHDSCNNGCSESSAHELNVGIAFAFAATIMSVSVVLL